MKNIFTKSISRQLTYGISLALIIVLFISGIFILHNTGTSYNKLSDDYLNTTVIKFSESTSRIIESEYVIGADLQSFLQLYEDVPEPARREYINNVLQTTLKKYNYLVDVWTVWEPDAVDGMDSFFKNTDCHDETGRFIPYWTKVGNTIECTALTDYEGSFWYENPLNSKEGILIDPNPYEIGGETIWVCGVAFPIRNKQNKPVGVVGVDMSLETLSAFLRDAKIYDTGYLSLISASGLKAVDKNIEDEGTIDTDYTTKYKSLFETSAKSLNTFNYTKKENNTEFLKIFSPIKIQQAEQIWFLGVNVPVNEVARGLYILRTIIFCNFLGTLLTASTATLLIIKNITKKLNQGVKAMKNIAQGDGDLTVRMDINNETELDQMYMYFNETMKKIQNSFSQVKTASTELDSQGLKLSDNMNDTAAAANEITSNIESVNKQILQQANEVKNTNDSVLSINTNVKDLISNIQTQSASVTESSASIEQMVANIQSVTNILKKNNETISSLKNDAEQGKASINGTVDATKKRFRKNQKIFLKQVR